MSKLVVIASLTLCSLAAAAPPYVPPPKDPPPVDAPPACIAPTGKDGLGFSTGLANPPKVVGTYKLTAGKPLDTPRLRLLVHSTFIPDRLGSSTGEWTISKSASLLPDVDRDGPKPENSVDEHGMDPMRINTYRITMRPVNPAKKQYEAVVEDLGCLEEYVHAPLAAKESKTFWVSTQATRTYAFSTGHWYDNDARMYFLVSSGLAPDVQQDKGTKTPHGWISVQAWENMGGLPSWDDRYHDAIKPGTRMDLPSHEVEILKVVFGTDTYVEEGRVHTKGKQPIASVLVKVTKKAKPSEGLIRRP